MDHLLAQVGADVQGCCMRKWIATVLALAVLLPVAACESSSPQTELPAPSATTVSPQAATVTSTAAPTVLATKPALATPTIQQIPTMPVTPFSTTAGPASPPAQGKIDVLDVHHLPLGDGKVSTSPQTGFVFSCQTDFKTAGAQHTGSWIQGDTWDLTEKIAVEGEITWPDAQFDISMSGDQRVITGNSLPVDSETGIFPIQRTDPAHQIDPNPNSIQKQNISFSLSSNPTIATSPSLRTDGHDRRGAQRRRHLQRARRRGT